MRVWLTKGLGSLRAADDESAAVLAKIPAGTTFEADVKTRKPRSGAWHRRYWALCSLIYANVEGFKSVREVHEYLKLEAGLVRTIALRSTGELVRIPDSIAFDAMDAEGWAIYWKRVLDVVHEHILPAVEIATIENEIASLAS